jgi:hypothetical protein
VLAARGARRPPLAFPHLPEKSELYGLRVW